MAMIRRIPPRYGEMAEDSFAGPALGIIFLVGMGALYFWLTGKKKRS